MTSHVLLNGGNKTIAAPMHRLDQALCAATVAQSTPRCPEPLRDGALTDTLVGPELFHEFVFGDDALAMLHEVDEHVKTLALEGTEGTAVAEFVTLRIELVTIKGIEHAAAPRLLRLVTLLPLQVSGGRGYSLRLLPENCHNIIMKMSSRCQDSK
jgi:hypothetical protein